jgi:ornithine cyclodeaminase
MPSTRDVAENANLIVTATPSHEALLRSEWILDGTHVTAIGADHIGKQELDPAIVARAGAIVVDSIEQCSAFGEISHALKARLIRPTQLLELGAALKDNRRVRSDDDAKQLTVADLTGLAIQDAQIALSIVSDQPIGLAS